MIDTGVRRWLDVKEAAERLGVGLTSLDTLTRAGLLRKYKIPGLRAARYDLREIDRMMESAAKGGPTPEEAVEELAARG